MSRLHVVLALLIVILAAYRGAPSLLSAHSPSSASVSPMAVTGVAQVPTPLPQVAVQPTAPIGEGTQQVLSILGVVLGSALLIAGGIYVHKRWVAARY